MIAPTSTAGRRARQAARGAAYVLVALVLPPLLAACGSRGDPLPPVYPNPPAIAGLTVAQRGSFAILRFPQPELFVTVGSEDVELQAVDILVFAERYPVLTAEILAAGVERRGEVMRLDAVAEAAAARAREAREAAVEQAAAEGREPPPPDPDAPATTARRRTPDQDALFRVPREVLQSWRQQGLSPDGELAAARRLVNAVDALWRSLGLSNTVLDPSQTVLLPDAGTIAAASERLVEQATYERPLEAGAFLGRAAVSRSVEVEQFEEQLVADQLQVAVPVGTPATGELRTRYFFAVRGRSTRDAPGEVTTVVALAPTPVPVAPPAVAATIGPNGVELSWSAPTGDLALRRLDPESLVYNVYRTSPDGVVEPTPLNVTPLTEQLYIDRDMRWGETYVYEVRALRAGSGTPPRESQGRRSPEVQAVDTYPPSPPSTLNPTRAGSRVTLQWTPSPTIDIVGYRVYRHPFPAPDVPLRFDPTAEAGEPDATAPRAAGPPPGAPAEEGAAPVNDLIAAGWQLMTPDPVPFSRYTDGDADPSVRYVYAVEAIDTAGNLSALAVGTEPGNQNPRKP